MSIRFGCQFYTWQMSEDKYKGRLDHITNIVKQAGFTGIESEICMLGSYYNIERMQSLLTKQDLEFAALVLVCDWQLREETEYERKCADDAILFLTHFTASHLVLCQAPGINRNNLRERQDNAISCMHTVASRAIEKGVRCSFHPNSPEGSVFRTAMDYEFLFDKLNTDLLGFAPDSGHIIKGDMDVYKVFNDYRSVIQHVHFKDINIHKEWTGMGEGVTDFPRIVNCLKEYGYNGWIMVEEESKEAKYNPDSVTINNGIYINKALISIT